MTKIRTKRVSSTGEPNPKSYTRPWGRRRSSVPKRPKLRVNTLRKANPGDALGLGGVETITRSTDGLIKIPAGTPMASGRPRITKKATKMTPKVAKGTKVVKPPSPTNRGGIKNPYTKRTKG